MVKRIDLLVRALRRARAENKTVSVVGWKGSNHSPLTRKIEKLKLVNFYQLPASGQVNMGLPTTGLVITSRFVGHPTLAGYTGMRVECVGIGTIRRALAEVFSDVSLKKTTTSTGSREGTGNVQEMKGLTTTTAPEAPPPGERAATDAAKGDEQAFLELLWTEFEEHGHISSRQLGNLSRTAGKNPVTYARLLLKKEYVRLEPGNQHRYYPGRRLFELHGRSMPPTTPQGTSSSEALPSDIGERLKALMSIVAGQAMLRAQEVELQAKLATIRAELAKIEQAEEQLKKIRELLGLPS